MSGLGNILKHLRDIRPDVLPHTKPEGGGTEDQTDSVELKPWNGIRPEEGNPAMDEWKENIGKPQKPGKPGGEPGGFPPGFRPDGGIGNQNPWSGLRRAAPVLKTLSGPAKPK